MAKKQKTIGVVGAGLMGAEIAFIYALSGHDIILCDKTTTALEGAKERLANIYDKGASRSVYAPDRKSAVLNKIHTTIEIGKYSYCDVVVEAVFEQVLAKVPRFSLDA